MTADSGTVVLSNFGFGYRIPGKLPIIFGLIRSLWYSLKTSRPPKSVMNEWDKSENKENIMGYPSVNIHNSTNYIANGKVNYASFFCTNRDYSVTPNTTWTAPGRGICLVTEVSATLKTSSGEFKATSYTSSGTSYSQYAIIQTGENKFVVTRIVSAMEDKTPADYVEPTEKQDC